MTSADSDEEARLHPSTMMLPNRIEDKEMSLKKEHDQPQIRNEVNHGARTPSLNWNPGVKPTIRTKLTSLKLGSSNSSVEVTASNQKAVPQPVTLTQMISSGDHPHNSKDDTKDDSEGSSGHRAPISAQVTHSYGHSVGPSADLGDGALPTKSEQEFNESIVGSASPSIHIGGSEEASDDALVTTFSKSDLRRSADIKSQAEQPGALLSSIPMNRASESQESGEYLEGSEERTASQELSGAQESFRQDTISKEVSRLQETEGNSLADAGMMTCKYLPHDELVLQKRYFGYEKPADYNWNDEPVICRACYQVGHTYEQCEPNCEACDLFKQQEGRFPEGYEPHWTRQCISHHRCYRCHGLGHDKKDCSTKFVIPISEVTCDRCSEKGHLEDQCKTLWHTYVPPPEHKVRRVQSLPIYCYRCGKGGHQGPQCPDKRPGRQSPTSTAFKRGNIEYYLDPNSENQAIHPPGVRYNHEAEMVPLPTRPKPRRVLYVESDGEEEEQGFIRPKVSRPGEAGPRSHIRFTELEDRSAYARDRPFDDDVDQRPQQSSYQGRNRGQYRDYGRNGRDNREDRSYRPGGDSRYDNDLHDSRDYPMRNEAYKQNANQAYRRRSRSRSRSPRRLRSLEPRYRGGQGGRGDDFAARGGRDSYRPREGQPPLPREPLPPRPRGNSQPQRGPRGSPGGGGRGGRSGRGEGRGGGKRGRGGSGRGGGGESYKPMPSAGSKAWSKHRT